MRVTSTMLATLAALLALPAVAGAKIIEVGEVSARPAPSCPASPCEVVSRTTAYQSRLGEASNIFVVPRDGRIVAWSITLGTPRRRQIDFFEENLGGAAQAGITVLRTGERNFGRVTGKSPVVNLTQWFGRTVQFPLATSIPVERGNVIALTVPTRAPALGLGLGRAAVWRASRDIDACDDTQTQSAQTDVRDLAQYKCKYRTARLTYSATMITTPRPPEQPRNGRN